MPPVLAASRHALRPRHSASSSPSFVWVSDDLLHDAFWRFTSVLPASLRTHSQCMRHASNVPGPLEARRRFVRRRFNSVSSGRGQQPGHLNSSHDYTFLFGLPNALFTKEPYLPPEWTWQPPGSSPPEPKSSTALPSWLLPPKPPESHRSPSYPSVNLKELLRHPSKKVEKVSVSEFQARLVQVKTLGQFRQLHEELAYATLDAPFCSSLAFDYLMPVQENSNLIQRQRPRLQNISISDLLHFVQNPKLEYTAGANLAKLADYLSEANSTLSERRTLLDLINTGLRHSKFSSQALAGFYRRVERLVQAGSDSNVANAAHDMQQIILANFIIRLEQRAPEVLPPDKRDLNNLNYMSKFLPNTNHAKPFAFFLLDRLLYSLETRNMDLSQSTWVIHQLGVYVKKANVLFNTDSMLQRLNDIWRLRNEPPAEPAVRVRLVQPLLRLINLLRPTKSAMVLTCDVIREHASYANISTPTLEETAMKLEIGQAVCNILLYEESLVKTVRVEIGDSEAISAFSSSKDDTSVYRYVETSSLTQLIDTLPSSYVEQWVVQTPSFLLLGYRRQYTRREDQHKMLQRINNWLWAIYASENHDWAKRQHSRHPVWKSVFWQLSEFLKPVDLPAVFTHIDSELSCTIILDNWIRRELESQYLDSTRRKGGQISPVQELYNRWVAIAMSVLEHSFEYWNMYPFYRSSRLSKLAEPDMALLKTLQTFDLPFEGTFRAMFKMSFAFYQRHIVDELYYFAKKELDMPLPAYVRKIMKAQMEYYTDTNPGRALGLFNSQRLVYLSRNPRLLLALISSRHSHAHPISILRLLWARDTGAHLSKHDPNRVAFDCPLSRSRIDLTHEAALAFATSPRFTPRSAYRCILQCLRYLLYHNAPLDSRISQACVVSGLVSRWEDPTAKAIPRDAVEFCLRMVKHVEGKESADAVAREIYRRDKYGAQW